MLNIKKLLSVSILAIAAFVPTVQAADIGVIFGGWSKHSVSDDYNYNESHNAIGIKYNNFVLSSFTNSYNNHSVVAAYSYDLASSTFKGFTQTASVIGGFVTGYEKYQTGAAYLGNGISLYLLPTIATSYKINDTYSFAVDNGLIISDNGTVLTTTLRLNIKF